jgi:uridine kinase
MRYKEKKLRVALLISGYLRSLQLNLENIKEKILGDINQVDVYLHITENEEVEDKYLNINPSGFIDDIKNILNPIVCLIEPNQKFSNDEKENILYNQWVKYYKLNELKKINEEYYGNYDLVIKTRPDLHLISNIDFTISLNTNSIFIPKDSKIDKSKLFDKNDGYMSDSFGFGSSETMNKYFSIYKNLSSITKKVGYVPETVIHEYLSTNFDIVELDIDYYMILSTCNVFAICGDSGSGKSTLGKLLSKYFHSSFLLECDRYHKWERNNENWSKYTHLNPKANFLTKMNQDIFDLKIGKAVYHVDYDHNDGKFTQKQKIDSSENLIVCGLHSLYNTNKNLFNIKIFMDTDNHLKKKWKVKRDIEKRNYTEEKILKQIEDRKKDYEQFILPQKENSNVIINFYEKNLESIGLKIKLHQSLNLNPILSKISETLPNVEIKLEGDFTCLNFNQYDNEKIFDELKFRTFDFYDYIVYILLNLNL